MGAPLLAEQNRIVVKARTHGTVRSDWKTG